MTTKNYKTNNFQLKTRIKLIKISRSESTDPESLGSPALSHPVEDGGVAEDDGDAGEEKAEDEEKLLRRLSVFLQDCARKCCAVQAQGAPNLIYENEI